jgi:hypothetical protein
MKSNTLRHQKYMLECLRSCPDKCIILYDNSTSCACIDAGDKLCFDGKKLYIKCSDDSSGWFRPTIKEVRAFLDQGYLRNR